MKMNRFRRPVNMQAQPPRQRTAVQDLLSKYFAQDGFTYTIPLVEALAPGQQQEGNVTIEADSDFLWQKATALVLSDDDAAVALNDAALTIVITDTASGRNLSNTGVPLNGIYGTGQLPFIQPTPKVFKASGQIQVAVANIGGATYNAIYLNFIGQKCYLKASAM